MFFDFLHVAHAFTCFYMFYHSLKVWVRAKGYSTHPSSQMVWSLPPSLHLRASPEAQPSMTCPPPWYSVKIDPCRVDCTLQVPHLHMKGSSRALGASVQWVSESWSHATDRSEVERERESENGFMLFMFALLWIFMVAGQCWLGNTIEDEKIEMDLVDVAGLT